MMELLAPAGNAAALHAAVQSGADAVYIGGPKFNARKSADNFTVEDIKTYADYCHIYGVDVHIAFNTLIKEKELPYIAEYAYELNDAGVDALIIQDIGAAEIIRKAVPDMALHASTQMTVTSLEGVKYLEDKGFSRVVLARELSRKEIEHICKNSKAEIEVFVHGAICMCYSGQCMMSSILGGRSGNRGCCAQPCRLSYDLLENGSKAGSGYILSPKDMALINELKALCDIGVSSLKIEGRLKSPEYVSAVVGIYRKYLDNIRPVSRDDMQELRNAFSRNGFTDGYFTQNIGGNMMSGGNSPKINSFSDEALKRADINSNIRKIPVNIKGTLKENEALEVMLCADNVKNGDIKYGYAKGTLKSEKAINKPLDKDRFISQLQKLGDTPFEAVNTEISLAEGITIPIKEINAVRRQAVEELTRELSSRPIGRKCEVKTDSLNRQKPKITLTAEVNTLEQAEAAVKNGIKVIYAPQKIIGDIKNLSRDTKIITKASEIFREEQITTDAVLVSSPAAIRHYNEKEIYGDFRLNIFNSETANSLETLKTVTLSPELNLGEIRALTENTNAAIEIIGYGRIPLMIMKNCPVKALGKCQKGKRIYSLRDRKNEEFPIVCNADCTAKILNSKPIYMADKLDDIKKLKINSIRLIFTVENFAQCDKIISVYKSALDENDYSHALEQNTFTRGHYYRGVE